MKKTLRFILKHLLNWIDVIEALLLILVFQNVFGFILAIVLFIIAIRRHWRVYKSKIVIKEKLLNERVQGNEGAQGSGKTSLMLYMASLEYRADEIYTIVPCKVNGEFTNVLTKEILQLKERLPLHTCILGDELTMFFNNLENKKDLSDSVVASTACLYQSIRHFTDGNIINTSVDMQRLNKQLEEKHAVFNKLLKQRTCLSSYIILPIYKIILKLTKKYDSNKHKYLGTYRVWTMQTFTPITHENYYYDLSNQDENKTKYDGFSNLLEIWAYNNLDYDYNDTYLRRLYKSLPEHNPIKWKDLEIDREMLHKIGYSQLGKYFPDFKN